MDNLMSVWLGEELPPINDALKKILNASDTTLGNAEYINILAISTKSQQLLFLWVLIHRLLEMFGVNYKEALQQMDRDTYLYWLREQISKRFPSLLELYDYTIVSLFTNVKFLRSREGFERKMEVTHIEERTEKASEIREQAAKKGILSTLRERL